MLRKLPGYLLQLAARTVLIPLWLICGLLPRRRDLWVFGSWGGYRFADNAAAFFRYCHGGRLPGIRKVWITRDPAIVRRLRDAGYEAHLAWSFEGIRACARAGVHLYDCFGKDTNYWVSRGALRVSLWSGVPLKSFERDIDNTHSRYYRLFHGHPVERAFLAMMMPWHVERPDLIIATSTETADITRRAFDVPETVVAVTGFPRNDILFDSDGVPDTAGRATLDAVPMSFATARAQCERVFIYLPTFRDDGSAYPPMDWERLDRFLGEHNARLFLKLHPVARVEPLAGYRNVIELPKARDLYDLLPACDALISDYSSIIFDYALLGRPILYYTPDMAQFLAGSRSLNFHPEEVALGPVCSDFDTLMAALQRVIHGESPGHDAAEQVMPRLHRFRDGGSSERVLKLIDQRFYKGALGHDAAVPAARSTLATGGG